jgi:hypothetical protein
MRSSLTAGGLTALALMAAPLAAQSPAAAAADSLPAPARVELSRLTPLNLTYQVMAQGNPVGTQRVRVVREGAGWLRTDSVAFGPTNQVLTSRWGADFGALAHTESLAGPMSGEASAQVADGRVRGEANLPPQAGGHRSYDDAVVPGMMFDGQDEIALEVAELSPGQTHAFPVFKMNTGEVAVHRYSVVGVETVTVHAGTFPAFRVEMTGGQLPMTLWLRREGLHIPVRIALNGAPIVVELQ